MPFRPVTWFATNKFVHLRTYLGPSLAHRGIPHTLRERVDRRLDTAIRLARLKVVLYMVIYASFLGTFVPTLANALAASLGRQLFPYVSGVFTAILVLFGAFATVSFLLLIPVNRTLDLLEADINVFGMEVVARTLADGGALPSSARTTPVRDKAKAGRAKRYA